MWFKIISLFAASVIFFDQYYLVIAKPMVGKFARIAMMNEFPFIVGIVKLIDGCPDWEENFVCSGVLVTKKDILTVAHCFEDEVYDEIGVLAGSNDLRRSKLYHPLWWVTYNDWAESMKIPLKHKRNDIANIRLTKNVTHEFNPVPLATLKNEELFEKTIVAASWGLDDQPTFSPLMKTARLTVLTMANCREKVQKLHGKKVPIHKRHICSHADPPVVMYYGDSGGPLLHNGQLIGVHKATLPFPDDPINPKKINVHTSIDAYREFVETVIDPNFIWC